MCLPSHRHSSCRPMTFYFTYFLKELPQTWPPSKQNRFGTQRVFAPAYPNNNIHILWLLINHNILYLFWTVLDRKMCTLLTWVRSCAILFLERAVWIATDKLQFIFSCDQLYEVWLVNIYPLTIVIFSFFFQ